MTKQCKRTVLVTDTSAVSITDGIHDWWTYKQQGTC